MRPTSPRPGPTALACALTAASLLGACGDDGDGTTLATVTIDEDLPPTRVQGAGPTAGVVPLDGVLPALTLDVTKTEAYESGDYGDVVTRISVDALALSVRSPESEDVDSDSFRAEDGMPDDLSFLSGLELYIVAKGEDREPELLGLLPDNDPALDPDRRARTLELEMTGVDILDFVEAPGGYEVRMDVAGTLPPDDVVFDGTVGYGVGFGLR